MVFCYLQLVLSGLLASNSSEDFAIYRSFQTFYRQRKDPTINVCTLQKCQGFACPQKKTHPSHSFKALGVRVNFKIVKAVLNKTFTPKNMERTTFQCHPGSIITTFFTFYNFENYI